MWQYLYSTMMHIVTAYCSLLPLASYFAQQNVVVGRGEIVVTCYLNFISVDTYINAFPHGSRSINQPRWISYLVV